MLLVCLVVHDLEVVVVFLAHFEKLLKVSSYSKIYERCRMQLLRACKSVWSDGRSYTLYSARHEFKARAEAVLPWEYVSALMGHKKKRSGSAYGGGGSGSVAPANTKQLAVAMPDAKDVVVVMRHNGGAELKAQAPSPAVKVEQDHSLDQELDAPTNQQTVTISG